ncbi:C-terminal helicase domain-containing protein, partial [Nanoarchaeota archaeon]
YGDLTCGENNECAEFDLFFDKSVVFINCNGEETKPTYRQGRTIKKGVSYFNQRQIGIVHELVKAFTKLGVDKELLSIISFYKLQMKKINSLIEKYDIRCKTVDGFQGQENEIVILSTVRANENDTLRSSLGFLTDERRLNVAITRPKNKLIIIGNRKTLCRNIGFDKYSKLIDYVKSNGLYISEQDAISKLKTPLPLAEMKVKFKKGDKSFIHEELVNKDVKESLYTRYYTDLHSLNTDTVSVAIENVLKKYDWHYYHDKRERKESLINAILEEGPAIVLRLLKWLSLPRVKLIGHPHIPFTKIAKEDFIMVKNYVEQHNLANQDIQKLINDLSLLEAIKSKRASSSIKAVSNDSYMLANASEYDLLGGLFD